jgi:iron(III) transport system substrate-binding protein
LRTPLFATALLGAAVLAFSSVAAEVNVYTARHYDSDEALYAAFTKGTGIKVNVLQADADKLIERLKAEGANSPADVFITVDAGRLWRATEADLLAPVKSAALEAAIPQHLRDPEGRWFAITKRVRAIAYSKEKLKPADLPTYEGLADPKWKGKLLIRSSNHIYNQSLVGSLVAAHGEAWTESWIKGVVSNLARSPKGGDTDQIRAVAAGEGDIAVVNHYYYAQLLKSSKPEDKTVVEKVGLFVPNQADRGAHINISGAGVLKTAPHAADALKFVEFLVSPEAQALLMQGNPEFPVVAGVKPPEVLAQFGTFKEDKLNPAVFGRNNGEALRLADRGGWR